MGQIKVFLDTDVVISALLSTRGASFEIIKNNKFKKIISKTIKSEVDEVVNRLNIISTNIGIFKNVKIIKLNLNRDRLVKTYFPYVYDLEDSHVVAGAFESQANFLLSHNTKHYKELEIRNHFGINVMKPGIFLQYLRSQNWFFAIGRFFP